MERFQRLLKNGLSIFVQLKKDERLISSFDFLFPTVNGFDRRQNVGACGEFFRD